MLFPSDNYNTDQATGLINATVVDQDSYIQTETLDLQENHQLLTSNKD